MDIFISYRRDGGIDIARNFWNALKERDYYSFFDLDAIRSGEFPLIIYENILKSDNFMIILSKNSLDRCISSDDDWVRKELSKALELEKNIIPIICKGFEFPNNLPKDIEKIADIQAVTYDGVNFADALNKVISRLLDDKGESLKLTKNRNISNTFYEDGNMSEEEKSRIRADFLSCQILEKEIFSRLLADKDDIVLFNPAIYEIDCYMEKYNHKEISHVYGLMNSQDEVNSANEKYSVRGNQKNAFYKGNMEHENFEDELDLILSENLLSAFDFADLTLILRDSEHPVEKLRQVADRVRSGGVIYIRELDHTMALAYPDPRGLFKKMFEYIRRDIYSGDYEAGKKVYTWMRQADLEDIHFEARQISTVGMKRKEKRILFETLFSYVEREYAVMYENEKTTYNKDALDWLREYYDEMEREFCSDDFFYSSGFMEFYGYVE